MTQTNDIQNAAAQHSKDRQSDVVEIDLLQLMQAVLKRFKLCCVICGTAVVLGLLYCFLTTPTYLANCRMLVEQGKMRAVQVAEVYSSQLTPPKDFISTQVKLLTSENILTQVYKQFNLGNSSEFAGVLEPLKLLEKRIVVKQIPNTSLIDLGFVDSNPQRSADITNFIAQEFINNSKQRQKEISTRVLEQLNQEFKRVEKNRLDATARVDAFKKKHGIISISESRKILSDELFTQRGELRALSKEILRQQTVVDSVRKWREQGTRSINSIPAVIHNSTLSALKAARIEALSNTLLPRTGGASAAPVKGILAQIDKTIDSEVESILISLERQLELTEIRMARVKQLVANAEEELKKFDLVKEDYQLLAEDKSASEKAYHMVLNRVTELSVAQSAGQTNETCQIIVPATAPVKAYHPNKVQIMAIVVIVAGIISVLVCIFLEFFGDSMRRRIRGLPRFQKSREET
jgi:uncharacterized protein involved in exopolysaccharide biosynthesis